MEGFDLNATDYLLKPFAKARFVQAVEKLKAVYDLKKTVLDIVAQSMKVPQFIRLRSELRDHKIAFDDIVYIESRGDYAYIHTEKIEGNITTIEQIAVRMTLTKLSEKLPDTKFVRIHRSYIVPKHRITATSNRSVFLGEMEFPKGKMFYDK